MRRLILRKDTLIELTADELGTVVAGYKPIPTVDECDDLLTGMYPTLPVRGCVEDLLKQ